LRRRKNAVLLQLTVSVCMVLGLRQSAAGQAVPDGETGFLARGTRQWFVLASAAEPLPIHSRDDGRTFVMQAVTWGQIMFSPRGWGVLRGQLEWGFELMPIMVMHQRETTYAFGGSPIFFRWRMKERGRFSPFLELNGGAIYSNHEIPEEISRFNFTAQTGGGFLLRMTPKHSLVLGYRLHHISNGGIGPGTRSVNSNVGMVGMTF